MEFRDVALKKVRADTNVKRKIVSYKKEMSEKASNTKKELFKLFQYNCATSHWTFPTKVWFCKAFD